MKRVLKIAMIEWSNNKSMRARGRMASRFRGITLWISVRAIVLDEMIAVTC